MSRMMSKDELLVLLQDDQVEAVPFLVTGGSMSPFLIGNRDTVYLKKCDGPLKKGDIVLYERSNGQLVLHRIVLIEDNMLSLIGDGQFDIEHGICADQVIGRAVCAVRKGKKIQKKDFWWVFFEKIWIVVIPLRKVIWNVVKRR